MDSKTLQILIKVYDAFRRHRGYVIRRRYGFYLEAVDKTR